MPKQVTWPRLEARKSSHGMPLFRLAPVSLYSTNELRRLPTTHFLKSVLDRARALKTKK